MLVVAAQVPIVGRRRAEKDGWGQVIAASFAELIRFSWDAGLDSHSITCQDERRRSLREKVGMQVHVAENNHKREHETLAQKHEGHLVTEKDHTARSRQVPNTSFTVASPPRSSQLHEKSWCFAGTDTEQMEAQSHTNPSPAAMHSILADEKAALTPSNHTALTFCSESLVRTGNNYARAGDLCWPPSCQLEGPVPWQGNSRCRSGAQEPGRAQQGTEIS